ncbi:hypothetical protein [Eikenella halliae]|nr:hypothetical protein [Eikenella halliae]
MTNGNIEMQVLKKEITELKKKLDVRYPIDVEDGLYKKEDIFKVLNDAYNLLDTFKPYSDDIDVAFMKSNVRQNIKQITRLLENQKWVEFNRLLPTIRSTIYQTWLFISVNKDLYINYIISIHEGISALENERSKLKNELILYRDKLNEFVELSDQIKSDRDQFEQLRKDFFNLKQKLESNYNEWEESFSSIESDAKETGQLREQIKDIHNEANQIVGSLRTNDTKVISILQSSERLDAKSKLTDDRINESYNELEKLKEKFHKQRQDIQNIVEDANRASMAGSFKTKVDELEKPLKSSQYITYGALIITAAISAWLLFESGFSDQRNFDLTSFLVKLPVVIPFVFIAWLSNKRNAYLFRLREDYAYKYASAMAFEGYKKQVQEYNQDMLEQLLKIALDNLGEKPHKVFDKEIKASPVDDTVSHMKDLAKIAKDGINDIINPINNKKE